MGEYSPPLASHSPITQKSSLSSGLGGYKAHLTASTYSSHTVKSFLHDLKLLVRFLGSGTRLGNMSTADLKEWLTYLRDGRRVPCSRKTLSRSVTSLKDSFRWLTQEEVLVSDPSASLVYRRASSPLPEILFEAECVRLLETASRAYLLILLLLECGVKKGELLGKRVADLDLSNPYRPEFLIRACDTRPGG